MTVIAWDGKTLAADKRMSFGNSFVTTTKISRATGGLIYGYAGDSALGREMGKWVRDGRNPETFPTEARTKPGGLIVISPTGAINYYTSSPVAMLIEEPYFTIGSGADYATAALYLGKTASEAVAIASVLDPNCGNGIDTLEL